MVNHIENRGENSQNQNPIPRLKELEKQSVKLKLSERKEADGWNRMKTFLVVSCEKINNL